MSPSLVRALRRWVTYELLTFSCHSSRYRFPSRNMYSPIWFVTSFVLLAALIWVTWSQPDQAVHSREPAPANQDNWRRTVDGWERTSSWPAEADVEAEQNERPSGVHPLLIALLAVTISVVALLVYSPGNRDHEMSNR